jgi:hypothetical protein
MKVGDMVRVLPYKDSVTAAMEGREGTVGVVVRVAPAGTPWPIVVDFPDKEALVFEENELEAVE